MSQSSGRERVAIIVLVDLDPIPGAFHTMESAVNNVRGILEDRIPHYNPDAQDPKEFSIYHLEGNV